MSAQHSERGAGRRFAELKKQQISAQHPEGDSGNEVTKIPFPRRGAGRRFAELKIGGIYYGQEEKGTRCI